ncbi:benzoate 4-monooxygenase cytochrome P450 [Aspergillus cavernicola]|uniref:Benzoate 4-monooxygenase cytochrome P450 n=1 Tax=Aspergillus cavernicola TaxID=176166 RepID=A0ABR4HCY0_9EURO
MYTTIPHAYIGAVVGLGAHHGLFIHGEWHIQAPFILVAHLIGFLYLALMIATGWQIISGYLLALFSSIAIYRLFFHRLKHFPGPFLASTTKIWHVWKARNSTNHFFLKRLQREYGDFVRTGPSEITVFHPDVFLAIYGPLSKCGKAEWYDLLHPNTGLVTTREKELHREQRRRWNRGFTSKALAQFKNMILPPISQVDNCIKADIAAGQVSEVSDLVFWLTFDRMGEFVLGKSFDMLNNQRWHDIILLLQKAMSILGPLSPTPWVVQIAFKLLPRVGVLSDWFTMVGWCESQVRSIQMPNEMSPQAPILAHYLKHESPGANSHEALTGDAISAIVAGSEPTASTIVGLLYELAKNPAQADKIRDEILQQGADIHDSNSLARCCRHLEAAIFEALRLYPAIPSAGNRKTSSNEGITIAGTYIPPDTTVVAPRFVIGRREDCFEDADQFIPERWTTRPEMVRNRAAFAPFGSGSKSCIGRALAMNDLMLVTAYIVYQYQMEFPLGETGDSVVDNWSDNFTSTLGRLRLVFKIREN